ncbi:hypothetical protein CN230_29085 [Sinorhizobium meliloti]|uniref:hypothetical protein n=1 Tax=Rhizobium meliloti TaxID=382 RepID=UPI000FD78A79|nr:hypothetical protein [Sinorhizobium meliloti]RVG03960.1 hypothetical protein CN230_29085 [Sinorhizobium meliloti]
MSEHVKTPERYVITAQVKAGEHRGERVWLHLTSENGGWWQWGPENVAKRFDSASSHEFKDALSYGAITGPAPYVPDPETIEVQAVPASVIPLR